MAAGTRRTGSLIAYALIGLLGLVAGFALVQLLAGTDDEQAAATTSSSTSSTSAVPIDEVALSLANVNTVDDALDVIGLAPAPPSPGLDVSLTDVADVGSVAGSTAFLATSPDLTELGAPFLPAADGSVPRLPSGRKGVALIALEAPITNPEGLIVAIVFEEPGKPAENEGPFAGATSAVAIRLGRSDVLGATALTDGSFQEVAPLGSARIDGPLITIVFDPIAPFRVVIARGFDSSLDNYGFNPLDTGATIAPEQLTLLGDVDVLVDLVDPDN